VEQESRDRSRLRDRTRRLPGQRRHDRGQGFGVRGSERPVASGGFGITKLLATGLGSSERFLRPLLMASRSNSATAAKICRLNLVACGLSTARKSTRPELFRV
jgi:hypothetical protein